MTHHYSSYIPLWVVSFSKLTSFFHIKLLSACLLTNDAMHEQIFSYNALLMQCSVTTLYKTEPDEIFWLCQQNKVYPTNSFQVSDFVNRIMFFYEFISNDHRFAVSNWTCTFFFFFLYLISNGASLMCTATYRTRAKQHGELICKLY